MPLVTLTRNVLERYLSELVSLDQRIATELGPAYDTTAWDEEHFTQERDGKWDLSSLAIEDGTPIGFLVASRFGNNIHIHRLAVDKPHRGSDIGSDLLARSLERAREDELRRCTVQTPASNITARDWYIRRGFTLCDEADLDWYAGARGVDGYPKNGMLAQEEGECWVMRMDLASRSLQTTTRQRPAQGWLPQ